MKFYIASKFEDKEKTKKIIQFLEERGYRVTADWTTHEFIKPNYSENSELSKKHSIEDIDGVKDCDVFILISDPGGKGMYIELGVAIALKKKIYVVGKHNESSMFFFHPQVTRKATVEEVFKELGIA